mmetsp:Transcript_98843/g.262462  ORF Transcript_98843/g.262462 Transcript_98843/m.262462 type:complete len:344 (-) Transcript_98843:142-1173(-)
MDIAACTSTLNGSVAIVLAMAAVTAAVLETANMKIMKIVKKKPWWPNAQPLQQALMVNFGYPEEACTPDVLLDAFAFILCICSHHFSMGAMMLPVLRFGWEGAGPTGQLMFKMAALGDVAFDVYDVIKKLPMTFFPEKVKSWGAPVPLAFFVLLCCVHHPLAMLLVIPMNLKYSYLPAYHRIATSLLLAAGFCFVTGQYKFTLNVKNRSEFVRYKAIVLLQFACIWYTRAFIWFPSAYEALTHFRAEGDTAFFVGGCAAAGLMSIFNAVMLMDSTTAAAKWLPRPLPETEEEREELQMDVVRQTSRLNAPSPFGWGAGAKKVRATVRVAVAAQKFKAGLRKHE